jgi:hypothetical protein
MGARQKLNVAHLNGGLLIAAFVGIACDSWTLFVIVLIVSVISACYTGDIRPNPRR